MIIVAFDLGSREAGCVVMEDGQVWKAETWQAPNNLGLDDRFDALEEWLHKGVLWTVYPRHFVMAVEKPYVGRVNAAMVLGQCLGILRCQLKEYYRLRRTLAPKLIQVHASEAKLALAGAGNASKEDMMAAAKMQFPGHEWTSHSADALGVALAAAGKLKVETMAKEGGDGTA